MSGRIAGGAHLMALGWGLTLTGAPPAMAAESYICVFTQECIGAQPCDTDIRLSATLGHAGGTWSMTGDDIDNPIRFDELRGAGNGGLRLVSTGLDPDAGATAMLSIFPGGQAFLSTHGNFPTPGVVTHLGICTPRGD